MKAVILAGWSDVRIERNVKIGRSVIFPGTVIEEESEIRNAIIGVNVHVGKDVVARLESVVWGNTLIEEFSKISSNVKIRVESMILPD